MRKSVKLAMAQWRELGLSTKLPKIHASEDHLIPQMEEFGGIGDWVKDFIEQAHQTGMQDKKRASCKRDPTRILKLISKWEHSRLNPNVQNAEKKVSEKTKRKIRENSQKRCEMARESEQKDAEKQQRCMESLEKETIPGPSIHFRKKACLEYKAALLNSQNNSNNNNA